MLTVLGDQVLELEFPLDDHSRAGCLGWETSSDVGCGPCRDWASAASCWSSSGVARSSIITSLLACGLRRDRITQITSASSFKRLRISSMAACSLGFRPGGGVLASARGFTEFSGTAFGSDTGKTVAGVCCVMGGAVAAAMSGAVPVKASQLLGDWYANAMCASSNCAQIVSKAA